MTAAAPSDMASPVSAATLARPGIADADHHRQLARDLLQGALDDQARFLGRELLRLAHHAEHRDAVHAGLDVEADQPLEALEVERALVGERRRGDDEDALRALVEQMARACSTGPPDAAAIQRRSARTKAAQPAAATGAPWARPEASCRIRLIIACRPFARVGDRCAPSPISSNTVGGLARISSGGRFA